MAALLIIYTNTFELPANPVRQKITQYLWYFISDFVLLLLETIVFIVKLFIEVWKIISKTVETATLSRNWLPPGSYRRSHHTYGRGIGFKPSEKVLWPYLTRRKKRCAFRLFSVWVRLKPFPRRKVCCLPYTISLLVFPRISIATSLRNSVGI